jgi:anthranilate synthase component 2
MKILIIDNYDSFTYNLAHAFRKISGSPVEVVRNDAIEMNEVERFDKIVLSPGPGIPSEAGRLMDVIGRFAGRKSMLGVCLGHQAIGEFFGGHLLNLDRVVHGKATPVRITSRSSSLFRGIPDCFEAGRYHSWIVDGNDFPGCLEITSMDDENHVMSLKHKRYDVEGVQFHPESILTSQGEKMLSNWLYS